MKWIIENYASELRLKIYDYNQNKKDDFHFRFRI